MIPTTKNRAFLSAYNKGKKAAGYGLSEVKNPYPDKLNSKGGPTFSRTFRRYWSEGWKDGKPEGFKLLQEKQNGTMDTNVLGKKVLASISKIKRYLS